jgi:hypothetical protein
VLSSQQLMTASKQSGDPRRSKPIQANFSRGAAVIFVAENPDLGVASEGRREPLRLPRSRRERPRRRCPVEKRDELAPFQLIELHLAPCQPGPELQDIELARLRQVVWDLFHNPPTHSESGPGQKHSFQRCLLHDRFDPLKADLAGSRQWRLRGVTTGLGSFSDDQICRRTFHDRRLRCGCRPSTHAARPATAPRRESYKSMPSSARNMAATTPCLETARCTN